MRRCVPVALVACSLLLAVVAGADQTIANAPVLTSGIPHADQAACYVRNVGTKPIAVTVQFIGTGPPTFDDCNGAPLAPGHTCVLLQDGPLLLTECAAPASSVKYLRGTAELRLNSPSGLSVWSAEDLQ